MSSWVTEIGLTNDEVKKLVKNLNEAFSPSARATQSNNSSSEKETETDTEEKLLPELKKLNAEIAKQYSYSTQRDPVMVALLSTSLSILETSLGNVVDNISSLLSVSIQENEKNVKRFNDQLATFIEMNNSLRNLVDHFDVNDDIRKNNQTNAENWYTNLSEKLSIKNSLPSADSSLYLFKHLEDLSKSLENITESLKPKIEDTLPKKEESKSDWKQDLAKELGLKFENWKDFFEAGFAKLGNTLGGFIKNLEIVQKAKSFGNDILNTLLSAGAIATIATLFGGTIMQKIGVFDSAMGTNISGAINDLLQPLKKYTGWVQTLFKQTVLFKAALFDLPRTLSRIIMTPVKIIEGVVIAVKGVFDGAVSMFKNIKTFFNPIEKAVEGTLALVAETGGAVAEAAPKVVGIIPRIATFLKKLPLIGTLISVGIGVKKLMDGDTRGGILSLASGLFSMLPYAGWALSFMIDAYDAQLTEEAGGDITTKNAGYSFGTFINDIFTALKRGVAWIIRKTFGLLGLDKYTPEWAKEEEGKSVLNPQAVKATPKSIPSSAEVTNVTVAPVSTPGITKNIPSGQMYQMNGGDNNINSLSSEFKNLASSFKNGFDKMSQMALGNVTNQSVVNNGGNSGPIPVSSQHHTLGNYRNDVARTNAR